MKRLMKKTISIVCAVALLITGVTFVPQSVNADDIWYAMDNTWPEPHPLLQVPEGETSLWTGCTGPDAQIECANAFKLEGFKWKTITTGEAAFFKTIDLKEVACVDNGSGLEKPVAGTYYNIHVKLTYTPPSTAAKPRMMVETSGGIQNIPLTKWEFNHSLFHPDENVFEQEIDGVICMAPGADFKFCINYGWLSDTNKWQMKKGTLEITEFTLTGDNSWTTAASNQDVSVPDTPWSVRANYNDDPDAGSYGIIQYKVGDEPQDISDTSMRLVSTVGEQEKYPANYPDVSKRNQPVDSADRWWWISAQLPDYATTAGLVPFTYYTGSITFNTDKATAQDCHLFVYVDGKEYPFTLQAGANTLTIPEFMYSGSEEGASSIKFLFDELPTGAIVSVSDITFTPSGDWNLVPNADDSFTVGPWNMFGNFDPAHPGNWGVVQYKANKENPQTYADYDIKAASVSGWLGWTAFVRLENYCADYLDEGDPYDLTITLKSSKATEPKDNPENDPDVLDKLLVLVGNEQFKFDLVEGDNTLRIHSDGYEVGTGTNRHEQIMFELDGLVQGTELTVKDIQFSNYPNDGWTNVPNKKDTKVGDWTLFGWWDETHYSKLAYKNRAGATGLGVTDIKVRRPSGFFGAMAALAMLPDYLATAKDTKNRPIANGDGYQIKVTLNASGLDDSVTNYGKVRLLANDQAFDFNIQKGTKTYDLLDICGTKMLYDNSKTNDIEFELDEVAAKAVLNISKIEFIGPDDESEDVPNGTAIRPEGTPWTLYAITDAAQDKYGAMRYEVTGDPANVSSMKLTLKSVSGWFGARSVRATLNNYLDSLTTGKTYKVIVKMVVDESGVAPADKNPEYDKKLRITVDNQDYDFNVANPATGTQTFEQLFTYTGTSKNLAFDFDQLLKGSKVSFSSIEIIDPSAPTTTVEPSTEAPTQPTTQAPTGDTTQAPTGETVAPQTSDVTSAQGETTTVKAPGKAKIKKVYKKKKSAKKLKVKLKKVKGAKGYQVAVYKSKKNAKKNKKALTKKYTKKLKVTLKSKKLKKKKKLYVRARAYVLDGNGIKVFGKWSSIKKGKTKK
ncbi:MAG: hypothetical protein J6W35_05025 [Eubacterium sp.]|nr:hypothetical protein [Eubacterium sp.]